MIGNMQTYASSKSFCGVNISVGRFGLSFHWTSLELTKFELLPLCKSAIRSN